MRNIILIIACSIVYMSCSIGQNSNINKDIESYLTKNFPNSNLIIDGELELDSVYTPYREVMIMRCLLSDTITKLARELNELVIDKPYTKKQVTDFIDKCKQVERDFDKDLMKRMMAFDKYLFLRIDDEEFPPNRAAYFVKIKDGATGRSEKATFIMEEDGKSVSHTQKEVKEQISEIERLSKNLRRIQEDASFYKYN